MQGCLPDEVAKTFAGTLAGIQFKPSSHKLRRSSKPTLDAVVKALKGFTQIRVRINGHTDSQGKRSANRKLSERRAKMVRLYLITQGIDAGRLEVKGHGSAKPIASNKTKAGRSKNRRIEFKVIK